MDGKAMMGEAQRLHDNFRRTSMLEAVEAEESAQDINLQMRQMHNIARRDSIGYNGMYGRGPMGLCDPMMGALGSMHGYGAGYGGLGGLGGGLNANMMFEAQLSPFGGMAGLGGGVYGMSQYDMQQMYASQMMSGMGGLGAFGSMLSPYSGAMGLGGLGMGMGLGGFGHGFGHHHRHPLMAGGFGLGHPVEHAARVRSAATAAAMSGGNPVVAASIASNPAIAMSSQLMGGVF